jgi:hypothetical protein
MSAITITSNLLVVARPDIAAEYSEANTKPLETLTVGAAGKYSWTCGTCSYVWESRVDHRVSGSSNCPSCDKKILTTSNPELAAEWGTQNETIPAQHKPGSRERVWWECPTGEHPEYKAVIANRRLLGVSCPQCQTPPLEKSLASVAPELIAQWSAKNKRSPEEVFAKAITPVIWECDTCSYEWTTRVSYRVKQDNGCPSCNGRSLEGKTVAEVLPHLVSEWSSINTVSPDIISAGSGRRITWSCSQPGHLDYVMTPVDRRAGYGCRQCVLDKQSLAVTVPKIAAEWHPTKNHPLLPVEVMKATKRKVWWLCDAGHEWEAEVSNRTTPSKTTGCPVCAQSSISSVEAELRASFTSDQVLLDVRQEHNTTLPISWRNRKSMHVDIVASYQGKPVVIEYDGWYWHSGQRKKDSVTPRERDTAKTLALLNEGYRVARIREARTKQSLDFLNLDHPHLLQLHWLYDKDSLSLRQQIYTWLQQL